MYRIKFPKKMYKTIASKERYLRQLYNLNKSYFDSKIEGYGNLDNFTRFKDLIKERQEDPYLRLQLNKRPGQRITVKQAAQALVRTRMFTSAEDLAIENIVEELRQSGQNKTIYKITGKNKILKKNIKYDAEQKTFKYEINDKVVNISFKRYPKGSSMIFNIT